MSLNSINICLYNNNGTVVADIAPIYFCNAEFFLVCREKEPNFDNNRKNMLSQNIRENISGQLKKYKL